VSGFSRTYTIAAPGLDTDLHDVYKSAVSEADYRTALAAAVKEYEELGARRREIDDRLAQLSQTIGTLNRLLGYQETVPLGLTDAIRLVMRSGVPMTPVEVRDRLRAIGFDVSKYANDLAAVHTILKRLNGAGELRFVPRQSGPHQYTLNRAVVPVVMTKDIVQAMHENAAEREAMRAAEEPDPPGRRRRAARRRIGKAKR
jgi:hypothetical protein